MKIGIVCYTTYGGSGVVASELGKYLLEMGHEVHFISYALPYRLTRFQKNLYFHEVEMYEYPLFTYPPYSLALTSKIVEVAEFWNLDIVHAHYAIPHATSACLAREIYNNHHLKVITTLHGTDITLVGKHPSFKRIVQFSINRSDGVTAVSKFLVEETCDTFDIENDIEVIYNFIPGEFLNEINRPLNFNRHDQGQPFILCHISNFRPLKRVEDLVPVVEALSKEFPVHMYMIGDGPRRSVVEHMVYKKGLQNIFTFVGKQESVKEILTKSDLFFLPSGHESFGLSALEAMACGVPCITSDAGGLKEINLHGQTGFVVPVGDINGIIEAAAQLLQNSAMRETFAQNARQHAFEHFHPQKIVPRYLNYYKKVLNI